VDRLAEAWESDDFAIEDGVALLRALDAATSLPIATVKGLREWVQAAILEQARTGCRSDELRELLSVIDTSDPTGLAVAAARTSFARFKQRQFSEDLRECQSREQFDSLIEDLQLFHDELGVDVRMLMARVEESKAEFEEYEETYADSMQDEWRERYALDLDVDQNVSDMFASLRGDRD
jgi:hypothetical protein